MAPNASNEGNMLGGMLLHKQGLIKVTGTIHSFYNQLSNIKSNALTSAWRSYR